MTYKQWWRRTKGIMSSIPVSAWQLGKPRRHGHHHLSEGFLFQHPAATKIHSFWKAGHEPSFFTSDTDKAVPRHQAPEWASCSQLGSSDSRSLSAWCYASSSPTRWRPSSPPDPPLTLITTDILLTTQRTCREHSCYSESISLHRFLIDFWGIIIISSYY